MSNPTTSKPTDFPSLYEYEGGDYTAERDAALETPSVDESFIVLIWNENSKRTNYLVNIIACRDVWVP